MHQHTKRFTARQFIPGIAWFFIVLLLLCLPGRDLPPTTGWMQVLHFDKMVHTGLFGIMTWLFMRPPGKSGLPADQKNRIILLIAVSVSLWGLTTEFIQEKFIPGRSFDLFDWAADSAGASLALIFSYIFYRG